MLSEEEFLQFLFECIEEGKQGGDADWPLYVLPDRVIPVQQVEPEQSQQEPTPEIVAPPVEAVVQAPKRHPALVNVYVRASSPLSGKINP